MARRWLAALAIFVVADLAAARLLLMLRPEIDLAPAEQRQQARARQEAAERRYRVESPVYDHDLVRNFDGDAWWGPLHYRVTTNSLGFRDSAVRDVPLAIDGRRVLLLGDSFTEGLGLDYAETYAGRIASRLGREHIDVLDAGVTSYAPAIYYAKTRYLIEKVKLQFTDVVVFVDISDAEDEARFYDLHADGHVTRIVNEPGAGEDFEPTEDLPTAVTVPATLEADGHVAHMIDTPAHQPLPQPSQSAVPARLKHHSITARAIDALARRRQASPELQQYPQANPRRGLWTIDERDYDAFGRIGLVQGSRHMDRLAALLSAHGITLTIAVYPWPDQIRGDTPDSIQVRFWRRWAQARGARFVDLFAAVFQAADRDEAIRRFYIPGDVHFNARGAALLADAFLAQWPRPS